MFDINAYSHIVKLVCNPCKTTNIVSYADEIEKAWARLEDKRRIVAKLDSYDAIADLSDPFSTNKNAGIFWTNRRVVWVYLTYCELKAQQGDLVEAAQTLAQFHSVIRKGMPYSRSLWLKTVNIAIANLNMMAARRLLLHAKDDSKALDILASAFAPLNQEEISLRSPFVFEYLFAKNVIQTTSSYVSIGYYKVGYLSDQPLKGFPLPRCYYLLNDALLFKRNATTRLIKIYYDAVIEGVSRSHPPKPGFDELAKIHVPVTWDRLADGDLSVRIAIKNPVGMLLLPHVMIGSRSIMSVSKAKVNSDMLAMEISRRQGGSLMLKDYYSEGNYVIEDKTGVIVSAGPDGLIGTKDDLRSDTIK